MPEFIHKDLAAGGWAKLSLMEQLAHIGSEVGRARKWHGRNKTAFDGAVERALDLFDLTLADPRWKGRYGEIARARELFCAAALGGADAYGTTLDDLENYFMPFALAAASASTTSAISAT
jgi:hypothetical protein